MNSNHVGRLFLILNIMVMASIGYAATYYIDYDTGSDSNAGTAKANAWKRHPYMVGFSGIYTHKAGDRYIFKGGVTWPRSCFQLKVAGSGTSETVADYYGYDATWYSGTDWSRPIFDMENQLITDVWPEAVVYVQNCNYIIFDGLEIKRQAVSGSGPLGAGGISVEGTYGSRGILITNCFVHAWSIPNPVYGPAPSADGNPMGGIVCRGNSSVRVLNCIIDGAPQSNCGMGVSWADEVGYCIIRNMPNGVMGAGKIHDNEVYNITPSINAPYAHGNAIYSWGVSTDTNYVFNNYIHDVTGGYQVIYLELGVENVNSRHLVYNNVVWNVGAPLIGLEPEMIGQAGVQAAVYLFNNTLYAGKNFCLRVGNRTYGLYLLVATNNHFITDVDVSCYNDKVVCGGGSISNVRMGNNLTQTTSLAARQGYVVANKFAPVAITNSTVGAGVDLSAFFTTDRNGRTRNLPWDIGAYHFSTNVSPSSMLVTPVSRDFGSIAVGAMTDLTFTVQNSGGGTLSGSASVPAPFSIVSGTPYSLTIGQSQVVTVRYSPTAVGTNSQAVTFTGAGGTSTMVKGSAVLQPAPPQSLDVLPVPVP